MSAIGQNSIAQVGQESTLGTGVTPVTQLSFLSSSLQKKVEKSAIPTLSGKVTSEGLEVQKISVEGDIKLLTRPENSGLSIASALGVEDTVSEVVASKAYKHTLNPVTAGSSLPSNSVVVNNNLEIVKYLGLVASSIDFEATKSDYLYTTINFVGRDAESASVETGLDTDYKKPFKFANSTLTLDGSAKGEITDFKLSVNNNLTDAEQTMGSDVYAGTVPDPQDREMTISLTAQFDTDTLDVKNTNYEGNTPLDIVVSFKTKEEISDSGEFYEIRFLIPIVYITEFSAPISGKEKITVSITGTITEDSSTDALTIELIDSQSTKYLA